MKRCADCDMQGHDCILPKVDGLPVMPVCFIPRKGADMATQPAKIPTLTDENVKGAMGFRTTDCCSRCARCTKHPDSGRGGELHETLQCIANAIHPFKLELPSNTVCAHFTSRGKPA